MIFFVSLLLIIYLIYILKYKFTNIEKYVTSTQIPDTTNTSKYIWSKGYNLISDKRHPVNVVYPSFDINNYNNIQHRDIICLRPEDLKEFIKQIFIKLENDISIILITCDCDSTIPNDIWYVNYHNDPLKDISKKSDDLDLSFEEFINDPRLLCWYAQNLNGFYESTKLNRIPIGIDYHTSQIHNNESYSSQENLLEKCKQTLPDLENRPNKVYSNFHINNTSNRFKQIYGEDREDIYLRLKNNPNIYFEKNKIPRKDFWLKMKDYSFSISPIGNGLDCHRTWELLILGVIPIVKTNVLDSLFKDLPVVIVKDWDEITSDNLIYWKKNILKNMSNYNLEKLYMSYWRHKINSSN